jgi:putative lipoprotein
MNKARSLLALVVLVTLLALPAAVLAQNTGSVTGTANILQRIALPNNAVVTIQLADVSRADAPAQVIAQQRITTNGAQAPFAFNLQYDKGRIATNGIYIVQGNITVGGQIRYSTTRQYRVLTGGNPSTASVTLDAVTLPRTSSVTWLPALAGLLLALALGVHLLRSRLSARPMPEVVRR